MNDFARFLLPAVLALPLLATAQQPKKLDSIEIQRAHFMLKQAHDELKKNYYDPAYHGVDLDATYA